MTMGTVSFMSPEQARGEALDGRSDIFSFGLVLYQMATGRQTFEGNTAAVVFDAILNRAPVPVGELNPNLPVELERIIDKSIEKNPRFRYQTASDLRTDLQRLKRDIDIGRPVPTSGQMAAAAGVGSGLTPAAAGRAGPSRRCRASPAAPARSRLPRCTRPWRRRRRPTGTTCAPARGVEAWRWPSRCSSSWSCPARLR